MALFWGERDISMFNHINRELLREIIDTTCDFLKHDLFESKVNLYGEALNKFYKTGVRVAGLIDRTDQDYSTDEIGTPDVTQTIVFSFFRETLKEIDIFPEVGDIIKWNQEYWEIDSVIENQLLGGKHQDTSHIGPEWGQSHSIICNTHLSSRSKTTLENIRSGKSDDNEAETNNSDFY